MLWALMVKVIYYLNFFSTMKNNSANSDKVIWILNNFLFLKPCYYGAPSNLLMKMEFEKLDFVCDPMLSNFMSHLSFC